VVTCEQTFDQIEIKHGMMTGLSHEHTALDKGQSWSLELGCATG